PGTKTRNGTKIMHETTLKRGGAPASAAATAKETPIRIHPSARKLYIKTFGCQMNEYDSDKMADVLRENQGLELTNTPEDADVILLNTCSIREKAQEKVFSDLGRINQLKKKNPNLVIGV